MMDPDIPETQSRERRSASPATLQFTWSQTLDYVEVGYTWDGSYPRNNPPELSDRELVRIDEIVRYMMKASPGELICTKERGSYVYKRATRLGRTV